MTKYKLYRISVYGYVTEQIVEAPDWFTLLNHNQFGGDPIFKMEAIGSSVITDNSTTNKI